ncbi:MAG: hypothetical protein PHU36_07135, partial [Syntrophomonadaceae bacterium]|nr:hypothetical protein [Syntrophomonadaceae bacterium]
VIQSTLLRYDGTIINDVYPFDIIPPTMTNVCMYLFNCLEDNLAFTDLDLTEVTIWLNQALLMRAKDRNRKFDELLQGRDESWRDLRGKFDNQ